MNAATAALWAGDAASQGLGMMIEAVGAATDTDTDTDTDTATVSMSVTAAMLNGHGICHGGFVFALADSAFAYACNAYGDAAVASHCAITYRRSCLAGARLTAVATERAREGRSGLYDVAVSADGVVMAEFRGHSRLMAARA